MDAPRPARIVGSARHAYGCLPNGRKWFSSTLNLSFPAEPLKKSPIEALR